MNTIDAGSAKLAGLQIDTLSKLRAGQVTLDQWERFNNLSPEDREARFGDWKREPKSPSAEVQAQVYLRRLYDANTFTIPATDGKETWKGSSVFGNRVYGETLPDGNQAGPTNAVVYEQIVNGSFAQVFGSLSEDRKRWQNQGQILVFCQQHKDKLRTDGYATFFEMEGCFVACVYFGGDGHLEVSVDPFSHDDVWYAWYLHLFVTPQQ